MKIFTKAPHKIEGQPISNFPLLSLLYNAEHNNFTSNDNHKIVETPEAADVIIIPQFLNFYIKNDLLDIPYNFLSELKEIDKPIWMSVSGDYEFINPFKQVTLFQYSISKSRESAWNAIMPSLVSDPYKGLNTDFRTLPFTSTPKVGFCGYATNSIIETCRSFISKNRIERSIRPYLREVDFYAPALLRYKVLSYFEKIGNLETDFIYRKQYRAGIKHLSRANKNAHITTTEYLNNLVDNQYTVCIRGMGNFSIRFYQTLAAGRIPLFIDVDSTFPLRETIEKKDIFPILSIKEKSKWEEQILAFHHRKMEKFEELQIEIRGFWKDNYGKESFFNQYLKNLNR